MRSNRPDRLYSKSTVILISAAPMGIFTAIIVVIIALGYNVNATVIQSLLSSLLLAILILTQAKYRLFRFLSPTYPLHLDTQSVPGHKPWSIRQSMFSIQTINWR